MKTTYFLSLAIAAIGYGLLPSSTLAEENSLEAPGADDSGNMAFADQALSTPLALPAGQAARYRVTYMKSNTSVPALRTATVVSITNQSNVTCTTGVDWRIGFAGTACTTSLTLGPGQTGEHCSRTLPAGIVSCNITCDPSLTSTEGSAIVGSSTTRGCSAIAVSARTYHTQSTTDSPVSAITDEKVVRIGAGNTGD